MFLQFRHHGRMRSMQSDQPKSIQPDLDTQKNQLSSRQGGYRNQKGYNKIMQSTSNIQMSSSLSNFADSYFIPLNRKKYSANAYQRQVEQQREKAQNKLDLRKKQWQRVEEPKYDNKVWTGKKVFQVKLEQTSSSP